MRECVVLLPVNKRFGCGQTLHWRIHDQGTIYVGDVTASGRFESDAVAKGGFVNSVTKKPTGDAFEVCFPVHGTREAGKE